MESTSEEPPDAAIEQSPARRSRAAALIAAGVIGIVAVGGGAYALGRRDATSTATAAGPAVVGAPFTAGTIAAIDGDRITLATDIGSITVMTASDTVVTAASAGTLSDLRVGDNVSVMASTDAPSTAQRIVDTRSAPSEIEGPAGLAGPPAGGQRDVVGAPAGATGGRTVQLRGQRIIGTVASIDRDSVSVTQPGGATMTFATAATTAVSIVTPTTVHALGVGTDVRVTGERAADGTITARSIRAGDEALPAPPGDAP